MAPDKRETASTGPPIHHGCLLYLLVGLILSMYCTYPEVKGLSSLSDACPEASSMTSYRR
ncbi:hypothetical protein LZ31DRAFT_294117 [Colletotrichum somersetense]|nr:hypothetical protein LZ31DRAFT_294117 [Colletotrichum somersetense]